MGKKKKEESNTSLMEVIPERVVDWEEDGEKGLAVLLVPRFRKGFLKKWLQPKMKSPFMKVKLDEIGSFVWKRCDGKRKVFEIASDLENEFGDRVKPVEGRINLYLTTLFKSQFIRYWQHVNTAS